MTAPLVTTVDFKRWARIETSAEDDLIRDLLVEVIGSIESAVGKSLTTESVVWVDEAKSLRAYGSPRSLILRYVPVDVSTVVVKDNTGAVVDPSSYTVRTDEGLIRGINAAASWDGTFGFDIGPYTITCTAGFGTSPTYETRELPNIRRVVMDYTAFLYQQRTPGARGEASSGSRVDYEIDAETGLPMRVARGIRKLRGPVVTA